MATVSATGAQFEAKEIVIVLGAGVAGIALLYWLAKREVVGAATAVAGAVSSVVVPVARAVNPASQENIVQKLGTAVVRVADQKNAQQGLTLSTKVVDWFNWGGVNDYDPNAADMPRG